MPSLALLFHLLEVVDGRASGPVSKPAAVMAVAWCDFLEAHAQRIYQAVTEHALFAARALAKRIQEGGLSSPFTTRDVYRNGWTGLSDPDDVKAAAEVLEDWGWIRSERVLTSGRPRSQYHINPQLNRKEKTV
jgi:putative DNA primase/helicase